MFVERIGHGYYIINDKEMLNLIKSKKFTWNVQ